MTTKRMTKEAKLLQLLRRGPVTSFDAVLKVPTTQAQYLVYALRQKGFGIMTEMLEPEDGASYAKWHLVSEPGQSIDQERMELQYE